MSVPYQMKYVGLVALAAGLGLSLGDSATAADAKYDQAKKVFADLKAQSAKVAPARSDNWKELTIDKQKVKVWQGPAPRITPVTPAGGGGTTPPAPVQMCVKVWAELSDPTGKQSGQFVGIELYKWKPKQQFYFWVEAPVPVQLSLFQNFDVGLAASKPPVLVSPNAMFPLTYTTVEPGTPFRFPQLFETDKDQRDEFVTLTVLAAGQTVTIGTGPTTTTIECPLNNPATVGNVNQNVLTQQTNVFVNQNPGPISLGGMGERSFGARDRNAQKLSPVNPDLPAGSNPSTFTSPDSNQVALFALGGQNIGHLPLRFSK